MLPRRTFPVLAACCAAVALAAPSQAAVQGGASAFKSCPGTAGKGFWTHLQVTIVDCSAGLKVMKGYAKAFTKAKAMPKNPTDVQGFSCTLTKKGETGKVLCKGTGDKSAVKFTGHP